MSYHVLARKWRPRSFQEMVSQENILRMLTNALDHQRLHHAYLFTGTRGVGKTTIARIFAKCLNCEKGISANPCGNCHTCQAIDDGRLLDLLEIDAASRTKVEDTRELLENVQYAPTQSRYKIYLIDEVHMLSGHSFNALLKTLEEPPVYVKFLLATTDPHRLPVTILSRCLQFQLKRVPVEHIASHLNKICTAENIQFEATALDLLADAADGSLRDALSLLDQTISFCGQDITLQPTRQMLGIIDKDIIFTLLSALANHDGNALLNIIAQLEEQGADFQRVLEMLLSTLHQISLAQVIKNESYSTEVLCLSEQISATQIQLYYQIALIGRRDLALSPSQRQGFEMIMLRMLAFKPVAEAPSAPSISSNQRKTVTAPEPTIAAAPPNQVQSPSSNTASLTRWADILPKLGLTGMAYALASNCTLIQLSDNTVRLGLATAHQPMLNKKLEQRIEQALVSLFNKALSLSIEITEAEIYTPAKQQQQEKQRQTEQAIESIHNDEQVKRIMDIFDAKLDPQSIESIT